MQEPIHLLDQMIDRFIEKAVDLDNTANDKLASRNPAEIASATMFATAGLTMRMVVSELLRIKADYVSAFVDDMENILEVSRQQSADAAAAVANVVPLIRPVGWQPAFGEETHDD